MWPRLVMGSEEVPCSVPYTVGLGTSCLPGQPQALPCLSHHTPRVCPRAPTRGTGDVPKCFSAMAVRTSCEGASLCHFSLGFPWVFSERCSLSQPTQRESQGSALTPVHRSWALTEPVCRECTPDGLKGGVKTSPLMDIYLPIANST